MKKRGELKTTDDRGRPIRVALDNMARDMYIEKGIVSTGQHEHVQCFDTNLDTGELESWVEVVKKRGK